MALIALTALLAGCDTATNTDTQDETSSDLPVPAGLDDVLVSARGLAEIPWIWLPTRLAMDSLRWSQAAIDIPLVELGGAGRSEGASYLVGDSASGEVRVYRADTGEATRILTDLNAGDADRRAAVGRLALQEIEIRSAWYNAGNVTPSSVSSLNILDADGDGWIRSSLHVAPRIRIEKHSRSYVWAGTLTSENSMRWLSAGEDGFFSTANDNGLIRLEYGSLLYGRRPDTLLFQADDTVNGARGIGSGSSARLERRDTAVILSAAIKLDDTTSFRDLRVRIRGGEDTLWSSTDAAGTGTLHWIGGAGRTDTVRIQLEGRNWHRLPNPSDNGLGYPTPRHGYLSRPMNDSIWRREDLEWTESARANPYPNPESGAVIASGTFRIRRWAHAGGGSWAKGTWVANTWGQRHYTTLEEGRLP